MTLHQVHCFTVTGLNVMWRYELKSSLYSTALKWQWSLGLPHPSLSGGHLSLPVSLTDHVPFGVVTEHQVLKLRGKCPTTGMNTAAESEHLAGHLRSTVYGLAGSWEGTAPFWGQRAVRKDHSFLEARASGKGQNQSQLYLRKRFT